MIQATLERKPDKKDEEKFNKAIKEYMNEPKGKNKIDRIFSKLDKKIKEDEKKYLV